jgi:hypothetical protein
MAIGNPDISVNSRVYSALPAPGRYIDTASSSDEPRTLEIDSVTGSGKKTQSFMTKSRVYKNVVDEVDAHLEVFIVFRGDLDKFTNTELSAEMTTVSTLLSDGNLTKLRRGER